MENKENLKRRVLLYISRGANTLDKLLQVCNGIYPNELKFLLNELKDKNLVKEENDFFVVDKNCIEYLKIVDVNRLEMNKINEKFLKMYHELPIPHPLDYEWRWNLDNLKKLFTAIINKHPFNNLKIGFLGAPIAAIYFSIVKNFENLNFQLTLIDRNEEIIRYIRNNSILNNQIKTICHDLQYEFKNGLGKNDIIIMDPPWYVAFHKIFISRASSILQPETGFVYSSLFPTNTRPNAIYERMEILEIFIKSGLHLVSLTPSFFKYETPHFESKSLEASGIRLESHWRYGDLIILQSTKLLRPIIFGDFIVENFVWKTVRFDKKLIKIKISPFEEQYIRPRIIQILDKSSILESVSRRHPYRPYVDMWTSDNEIFHLTGRNIIYFVLNLYSSGENIQQIVEKISKKYGVQRKKIDEDIKEIVNFVETNIVRRE
ncbi:bis-aminopropyl spermidine synthase family protein [Dehalococcoidia bacterium]|nr:bis-aminopropyl spermidine synthase family protein [Dehalococcoidia bacterium]MCL0104250.1 bis-aminopropyl spermidine synthase family protein [Dehalococcoidia bacterium]